MNDRALDTHELELAALYALSALGAAEMEEVERDFRDRRAFWSEVRSLRDAAAGLAETGPRAKPKRDLWPEIRAGLHPEPAAGAGQPATVPPQVWKRWRGGPVPPSWVLTAGEAPFEPTDIAGITVRRLFVDEEADRVTMLIRMEPGTAYPAHRHGGAEECYVVQGDLSIGDEVRMQAGDYQRMDRNSVHAVQSTRGGCLLLVTSSQHDELLG
jgi:quercetin dioxygenase-like cupin family protein